MIIVFKKMKIVLENHQKTKKLGELVGKEILKKGEGIFLALEGDLGSGKTTFLQGVAKGLGVKESISSPTFVIYKKYDTEKGLSFFHFDAYRIKKEDLEILNFYEIIANDKNIVAVEWSENIKGEIPKKAVTLSFSLFKESQRRLIVKGNNGIITNTCLSF